MNKVIQLTEWLHPDHMDHTQYGYICNLFWIKYELDRMKHAMPKRHLEIRKEPDTNNLAIFGTDLGMYRDCLKRIEKKKAIDGKPRGYHGTESLKKKGVVTREKVIKLHSEGYTSKQIALASRITVGYVNIILKAHRNDKPQMQA